MAGEQQLSQKPSFSDSSLLIRRISVPQLGRASACGRFDRGSRPGRVRFGVAATLARGSVLIGLARLMPEPTRVGCKRGRSRCDQSGSSRPLSSLPPWPSPGELAGWTDQAPLKGNTAQPWSGPPASGPSAADWPDDRIQRHALSLHRWPPVIPTGADNSAPGHTRRTQDAAGSESSWQCGPG